MSENTYVDDLFDELALELVRFLAAENKGSVVHWKKVLKNATERRHQRQKLVQVLFRINEKRIERQIFQLTNEIKALDKMRTTAGQFKSPVGDTLSS